MTQWEKERDLAGDPWTSPGGRKVRHQLEKWWVMGRKAGVEKLRRKKTIAPGTW